MSSILRPTTLFHQSARTAPIRFKSRRIAETRTVCAVARLEYTGSGAITSDRMSSTSTLKRKSPATANSPIANKKTKSFDDRSRYKDSTLEIKHGIVLREFYPPEMTNERARKYISGEIERPIETLQKAVDETKAARERVEAGRAVVHWFKCDIRTQDNRSLYLASELATKHNVPLICLYIVSPQDYQAHLTAPVRVDFVLRTLEVLKTDLAKLDIPLYVETVEKRKRIPARIIELCQEWGASHLFCNMEYEADELRREALLTRECVKKGIGFTVVHDTCVVQPGKLKSGTGGQISIYSPWHRKWCAYLNAHRDELDELPRPNKNPPSARKEYSELFKCPIPPAPSSKSLTAEEKTRFASMWPPGEHEAHSRLQKFISERIKNYSEGRNFPAGNGTSVLSPHLAAGTLSARTCVRLALDSSPNKTISDDRKQGHSMWIGEVAWRDFYRHVLVHWPYVCMNKPFKPEYASIEWEYDEEQFQRWCEGKTGFPIVDAAMRQAAHTGYMHNRCRMIVASFLAKDLLIDWRMGERWFMEHLVDGDLSSNNGGWSWSSGAGVDPQPYFRIFNPLLQSEKFDPDGAYIRKWVEELRDVKGKAIHAPYERGAEAIAKRNGYPRPMVEHKGARERALARYKEGIERGKV